MTDGTKQNTSNTSLNVTILSIIFHRFTEYDTILTKDDDDENQVKSSCKLLIIIIIIIITYYVCGSHQLQKQTQLVNLRAFVTAPRYITA